MSRILDLLSHRYDIELLLGVDHIDPVLRQGLTEELKRIDEQLDTLLTRDPDQDAGLGAC
jgi:hypothetical protein